MPAITFEAGQLDPAVKKELIQKLTDVAVEVTGIPKDYYYVSVTELPDDSIAVGGVTVTELKANLAKKIAVESA